jgi:hypothetical protein
MRTNTSLHIGRILLTSVVGLLLLVGIPTASEALNIGTTLQFGSASAIAAPGSGGIGGAGCTAPVTLTDPGTMLTFTGCVTPVDTTSNWLLTFSGTITSSAPTATTILIQAFSDDYASKPDNTYFDTLSAQGTFHNATGVPDGTNAAFTYNGAAALAQPLPPMTFTGSSSHSTFPPPSATHANGLCATPPTTTSCHPEFTEDISLTVPAGGDLSGSRFRFSVSQQPPCGANDEDNGNGRVADQNGNNGGDFDDNECDGHHHATHDDPDHNMHFDASTHWPVAFSIDPIRGLVATTMGEGTANGNPVMYVLVQGGGLPGSNFYSLTLSNASGVIYHRSGTPLRGYGTGTNVRH